MFFGPVTLPANHPIDIFPYVRIENMMSKTYNYILFDWDGTLSNTLPAWFEAHRATLETNYGISLSDEEIIEKMLVHPHGLQEFGIDKQEYFDAIFKYARANFHSIELHNNVVETLEELRKRDKHIAIVTSQWKRFVKATVNLLNFNHLFDYIVANEDVTNLKPHPEPIQKALKWLHGTPDETIMIGDTDADINAAKNAGVTSVWFHPPENLVYYPHGHYEHLYPDFTIRSMTELLDIVK